MTTILDQWELTLPDRFLITIIIIILSYYLYKLIAMMLHRQLTNVVTFYKVKTLISQLIFLPLIIFIILFWMNHTGNIGTYLGLLSAGIAFALRDIILNIASWLYINTRKPFHVGDRIQVGEFAGDVIDQKIFHFTLMEIRNWVNGDQSTGRILHVPNYKVFSDTIANFSRGFHYIWNEVHVNLTLDSNWEKAKELLMTILNNHSEELSNEAESRLRTASRKYMIYYNKLTPTVYTTVKDSQIQLSMRYLCEPRNRRNSNQAIWEDVLKAFKEESDITLK